MAKSGSLAFLLLCAISLTTLASTALAQNSHDDFLNPQNAARSDVGVRPLSWNNSLETYANGYANQRSGDCQLIHSGGPYGENIFWGSSEGFTATDAVNNWVSEKQFYDHGTNSCAGGRVCGHYTQVVWAKTTGVGCARKVCNGGKGVFIICSYYPPGNFVGESPYP